MDSPLVMILIEIDIFCRKMWIMIRKKIRNRNTSIVNNNDEFFSKQNKNYNCKNMTLNFNNFKKIKN
ncbi:uncharacterized protein DS421_3g88330 [Arachis hypogaea]|nr:uncharacterized protein DS421_3g88330 [Arachis hypogaea]